MSLCTRIVTQCHPPSTTPIPTHDHRSHSGPRAGSSEEQAERTRSGSRLRWVAQGRSPPRASGRHDPMRRAEPQVQLRPTPRALVAGSSARGLDS